MVNILIFRTDRIGDLLLTCPAIITIKKYFPNSKVSIVTSEKNFQYAKNLHIFENVYLFPNKNILKKIKFIYKISKLFFDYIYIFDGKERSIIASIFIKSKNKLSLATKNKPYYKILNIKFFNDNKNELLNQIFQKFIVWLLGELLLSFFHGVGLVVSILFLHHEHGRFWSVGIGF